MTAQAENLSRTRYGGDLPPMTIAAAKGVVFYEGAGVIVKTDGFAYPAVTVTGAKSVGIAAYYLDTTADAADGTHNVIVKPGTFGDFENSASSDLIAEDDRFKTAYWVDSQTLALTDGGSTRSAAGPIYDVNDDGTVVLQFEVIR